MRTKKLKGDLHTLGFRSLSLLTVVNKRVEDLLFGGGIFWSRVFHLFSFTWSESQVFFVLLGPVWFALASWILVCGMLPGLVAAFPDNGP